jgi:hypothetical protein
MWQNYKTEINLWFILEEVMEFYKQCNRRLGSRRKLAGNGQASNRSQAFPPDGRFEVLVFLPDCGYLLVRV